MLYILGGAARAGKSTIAQTLLAETGIPYFCLDYLMMGIANGLPAQGVDPDDDELQVGVLLWPIVESMAVAMLENAEDYLLEGVQLNPRHVRTLCNKFPGQVRACFVGYAEVDARAKFREIRRYGGGLDDWLREYDDQRTLREVERLKALSQTLQDECDKYALKYIETAPNLAQTVEAVVRYLAGG